MESDLLIVIILHYFVLLCPFLLWMLQTFCWPEFHIPFYLLNAYRGLLTLRRVSPFVAKNLCEKHKSGAGEKKARMPQKTQSFGPVSPSLYGAFFVLRDWAVILSVKHEKWGQMSGDPWWDDAQRSRAAPPRAAILRQVCPAAQKGRKRLEAIWFLKFPHNFRQFDGLS